MVNCTRSTVVTLVCLASLAYRLLVTVQQMVPPILRGQCRRMISSVANGQRFCYLSQLQQHFCHESSSTHTTVLPTATSQMSLNMWCQHMQRAFWYCVTALAILHIRIFFANKIMLGSKFHGGNHPWKLNL